MTVLHQSELKLMAKSPAHYKHAIDTGRDGKQTAAQRFGTLVHCLVLSGRYTVYEGERRGKAWASFAEAHEGELIVTSSEATEAMACARAVLHDPVAGPLLRGTMPESKWQTRLYGREMAGTIDAFKPGTVIDLKTASTTEPRLFQWACKRMHYDAQLAIYCDAMRDIGHRVDDCYIIGVEQKAPHCVTVLRVTERALDAARRKVRLWIEQLNACEAADAWPGYTQTALELDVEEDEALTLTIDGEELEVA